MVEMELKVVLTNLVINIVWTVDAKYMEGSSNQPACQGESLTTVMAQEVVGEETEAEDPKPLVKRKKTQMYVS